jgi:phosphotriesterase-related protein
MTGPEVQTARGPVDAAALGRTLMHEHVFIVDMEIRANYPPTWGSEDARVAAAVEKLDQLHALGIDTVVDLTVLGLGRDVGRVKEVAMRTDVNIVVATGLWTLDVLPHWFDHRTAARTGGSDPMVDLFVHDITEGIAATGVRAAILKCAVDEAGMTPAAERVLRAVARAHRLTGVPISTHTHAPTRRGLEQQRVLGEEGVDLGRVVIGHSGDTTDLDYLEELLAAGSYLGMDRFGVDALLPFEDRVKTVAELCRRGHASRLVLSHDACCYNHTLPDDIGTVQPNWHFRHIPEAVLPALREQGVTEAQLDEMLIHNPRRVLTGAGAY